MRTLDRNRLDLIDALVAERDIGGITAGILEKDEHLTDALRAVFSLKFERALLAFCGGTSLSKAHQLIERMSEDADIKVVLSDDASTWGASKLRRYLGDEVREQVVGALAGLGFVEDADERRSRNANRFIHTQWTFERAYAGTASLRPNLQVELIARKPVLGTTHCVLTSMAERLSGRESAPFSVPTIMAQETQAEKVLSFLRRFAQHRDNELRGKWDNALVRHIYDVHCINAVHPEFVDAGALAFADLVEGDVQEFGVQYVDFAQDPLGVLNGALQRVGTDQQTRAEYEGNLLPLIYGSTKPHFDEAFVSFQQVAQAILAAAGARA